MPHRSLIALVGLGLLVVTACSSSSKPHAQSPSPRTTAAPSPAPLTSARARAVAGAIGLRASDLRGFTVDANPFKNKLDPTATAIARCLGVPPPNQSLADVRSDYFGLRSGPRFLEVGSEVLVRSTTSAVTRDIAALRKPAAHRCFERYLGQVIARGFPSVVIHDVHVSIAPLSARIAGYQLTATMTVTLGSRSFPGYATVRAFALGHVEVSLDMFGFNVRIPPSYDKGLSGLLAGRAFTHRL